MAEYSFRIILAMILPITLILSISTIDASKEHQLGWINPTRSSSSSVACNGSMGDCKIDEEFIMDSEINRRILATNQYISYGALKKNNVPCSQRGASYYNCKTGAQANPYTRGCNAITLCRS